MTDVLKKVDEYYTEKILKHGPTPAGVDWNGTDGQILRFKQLLLIINSDDRFSISDLGCGYGELFSFLLSSGFTNFSYIGIDISEEMIQRALEIHGQEERSQFRVGSKFVEATDYCVASGIFNVKLDNTQEEWESFIFQTLGEMNSASTKGFSCNFLTSYSDRHLMKDYLYYADPLKYFDYCKKNLSKNVALLHDYGLYEFTLHVRK